MCFTSMAKSRDVLVNLFDEFLYYLLGDTEINVIINNKMIKRDTSIPFEDVKVL